MMNWLETLPDEWWNQYQSISLSSECIHELNIELLFIVRSLIIETRTYARVCKRVCLRTNDFQNALDSRNIHQSVNFSNNVTQTKLSTISVTSVLNRTDQCSSKIDRLQIKMHWLAIDGEQPIISDNPSPYFNEDQSSDRKQQKLDDRKIAFNESPLLQKLFQMANSTEIKHIKSQDYVHPLTKNNLIIKPIHPRNTSIRRSNINNHIPLFPSTLAHELSLEQQLYFKSLTESCFNGTDKQQTDAFHCLSSDAALQPLLPRLLLFLAKGIETNISLHDLHFLNQFLSILKMLTLNTFLSFDKYLHLIIPTLLTSLLCIFDMPKLSSTINPNNYSIIWIIREQTSDLISYFENKYSTIPYFTERIVSIIKSNLITNNMIKTFSIIYSCIRTLLLINNQIYRSFVNDILRKYQNIQILESDFDLDYNEQQILFNEKLRELTETYNFILEDMELIK